LSRANLEVEQLIKSKMIKLIGNPRKAKGP